MHVLRIGLVYLAVLAGILLTASANARADHSLLPIEGLSASGISRDGTVVVGMDTATSEPGRWTVVGGVQRLSAALPGSVYGTALAPSADGGVIVGSLHETNGGWWQAFRWTETGGLELLATPPYGLGVTAYYSANDVTGSGNTSVGSYGASSIINGFSRLTFRALPSAYGDPNAWWATPPDQAVFGTSLMYANAIADDGVTIGGGSWNTPSPYYSYASPAIANGITNEITNLPTFAGSDEGLVNDLTPDASFAVGHATGHDTQTNQSYSRPVLWDLATLTLVDLQLGVLRPLGGEAFAVSTDGSVVVGTVFADLLSRSMAFVWSSGQFHILENILSPETLAGWQLESAFGISGNGRTIVGSGKDPHGTTTSWLLTLDDDFFGPAVPEPSSLALLLMGGVGLVGYARRYNRRSHIA